MSTTRKCGDATVVFVAVRLGDTEVSRITTSLRSGFVEALLPAAGRNSGVLDQLRQVIIVESFVLHAAECLGCFQAETRASE